MLNLLSQILSQFYDILSFADIPFIVAFGVILIALGFLGKISKPTQI